MGISSLAACHKFVLIVTSIICFVVNKFLSQNHCADCSLSDLSFLLYFYTCGK